MKKVKRLWARTTARPTQQYGSAIPPRQSTQTRPQLPEMETNADARYAPIVDDKGHFSDPNANTLKSKGKVVLRTTWQTPKTVYDKVCSYDEVEDILERTGLCAIFKQKMPNSDRQLVTACIYRWWDTTHTFHLPTCEIGLTPLDFTMLSGIPLGGTGKLTLPPYSDGDTEDGYKEIMNSFFPNFTGVIDSAAISGPDLSEYLLDDSIMSNLEPVIIARVFCFYIIGFLFFPNASGTCTIGWIYYLINMENVGNYDWGSAILGRIYSSLDVVSRGEQKSVNCFWQIIEFLFYEYTATCTPLLILPLPNEWPRIHRWIKSNHVKNPKGVLRNKFDVASAQLEMRSTQSIIWQPYQSADTLQNPINQISAHISKFRYILLDPQVGGNWYLGDRCYRQISGRIAIPADPLPQMKKVPRYVFEEYNELGWPERTPFVREVTEEIYKQYWSSVSRGSTLAPLSRGVNTDVVGYAALVGGDVPLPCTPLELQGRVYNTQGASSSEQLNVEWYYEKRNIDGDLVTIPVEVVIDDDMDKQFPSEKQYTKKEWREMFLKSTIYSKKLREAILEDTTELDEEIARIKAVSISPYSGYNPPSASQPWSPYPTPDLDDF